MYSTIETLEEIIRFRDERDWAKFHNVKDLAISIAIEAGELLECFQWKSNAEINELVNSEKRVQIEDEIADISIYLLLLCEKINVDLNTAIRNKLEKNKEKYPVSKSKGNAKKYDEL